MKGPLLILWVTLACAVAAGLIRSWSDLRERSAFQVVVAVENRGDARHGQWQLFYDRGSGIVEEDSATEIREIASGEMARIVYRVPANALRGIRFDLPPGANEVLLGPVEFRSGDGEVLRETDPRSWEGAEGLRVTDRGEGGGVLAVSDEESADPQVRLVWEADERLHPAWIGPGRAVVEFVRTAVLVWVLIFGIALFVYFYGRRAWSRVFSFRVPFPSVDRGERGARTLVILASSAVFVPVVLFLSWEHITTPGLLVEDSHHYFNRYYDSGHSLLDAVQARPNGYYNIANNAYAWAVSRIDDVRWHPAAYNAAAVTVFLIASILPAFTPLVRNRWLLATVVPVLGLAGMNHVFYLITLTFQMYVVVLILLTILFLRPPRTTAGLVVQCLLVVFLVYSGPYSVVAVPTSLLLLLLFRDRRKQILWGVAAVAGFAYNRMTPGMARFDNLLDPEIVGKMITVTFEQVFFLDLGGVLEPWKIGVFFLLLAPAVILVARDPVRLRVCLVLLALVLLALTPLFLSRKFFFYSDPAPCHILISRFFWLLLLIYLLDGLVERLPRFRLGFALAAVATMAFFIWGDTQIRPWKFEYPRTRSVAGFMETIRKAERLGLKERNEYMMLAMDGNPVNPFGPRVRVGSQKSGATRVPAIE
ncbi:MAG: hypothetical protein ACLFSZ_09460 [Puniceicoccaceae bacterium]